MVRAHRQAWCWQDEWYGLSMENIRELEKEAQLMLSRKMAQFSDDDDETTELSREEATQDQASGEPAEPSSNNGEPLAGRGLKKQWSTSSKSSRSSKRGSELTQPPLTPTVLGVSPQAEVGFTRALWLSSVPFPQAGVCPVLCTWVTERSLPYPAPMAAHPCPENCFSHF